MSILSKIKSFLAKPLSFKYLSKYRSNEVIYLNGNIQLNINGITITITEDKDITIEDVRFFEIKSTSLFLNCDNADKLKKMKLEDPSKLEEYFKVTPKQIIEARKKYEASR